MDNEALLNFSIDNLPNDLEAEQSVLGCMLIDLDCVSDVFDSIKEDHFYYPQNRALFASITQMFLSAEKIDVITILSAAKNNPAFESEEEAKRYIASLVAIVPTSAHLDAYIKIVEEKFYLRGLIKAANEILNTANQQDISSRRLLDYSEQLIYDLRQGKDIKGLRRIDQILIETYENLQKASSEDKQSLVGLSTGFSALDSVIGGLKKSDLVVLAARPSVGKSSFAMNIAANVAIHNHDSAVAVFSLEMSSSQLATRMLSSEALVDTKALFSGNLTGNDWTKIAEGAQLLTETQLYIDDTSAVSIPEMKAKLRRLKNLGLVVIDYLQLMNSAKRIDNRVQEVGDLTRNLKIMAKELNVPVILLSQLSRGPEQRTDHRPMLADLRDSGSIEQDADIVLFLYRDELYNPDSDRRGIAECIVAKNRNGEVKTIDISWNENFTRFSTLEHFR